MNPLAIVESGMPPIGRGVFCRATVPEGPYQWAAVNGAHRDYRLQAAEIRRRGWDVWIFSGPDYWTPDNWRNEIQRIKARAIEIGAVGIIVDPENDWPELTDRQTESEARELGKALKELATVKRVGISSYPYWPGLRACAAECSDVVFGLPQMYDRHAPETDATLANWWGIWQRHFGARLIPCVAAWPAGTRHLTPAGMHAYLSTIARICAAPGAAAWPEQVPIPAYINAAMAEYQPGGSAIGTVIRTVEAALLRPVILAVVGSVVLIICAMLIAFGKVQI